MGSLRIGHGYALAKHPTLLQLVKERDIAIEINPLSNQVRTKKKHHVFTPSVVSIDANKSDKELYAIITLSH